MQKPSRWGSTAAMVWGRAAFLATFCHRGFFLLNALFPVQKWAQLCREALEWTGKEGELIKQKRKGREAEGTEVPRSIGGWCGLLVAFPTVNRSF